MSSPRTSQEVSNQASTAESPAINMFSLFRREHEREQQEREAMLIKSLMIPIASLILKLDGTVDMTEIQQLAKIMSSKNTASADIDNSDSDDDSDRKEISTILILDMLSEKLNKAIKPLVTRFMQDESNAEIVKDLSLDDAMRLMKPKYIADIFDTILSVLLSKEHIDEFDENITDKLKAYSFALEHRKPTADTVTQVIEFLFGLSYKNQDTKKKVFEGISDYYMTMYCAFLSHSKKPENEKEETVAQEPALKF